MALLISNINGKKTSNNKSLAENTRLLPEFTGTGKTHDIDTQHAKKRIVLFIAVL